MSEAIELYKRIEEGYIPTGVFYCSKCRSVFKTAEEAANCHGDRICECGKKIERRFYAKCNDCDWKAQKEKSAAIEFERYEKATKIPASEWKGDKLYDGDQYYDEIEDLLDRYDEVQEPEYVWACKNVGLPRATSEGIIEHMLDGMWDDADSGDLNGLEELDAAIAKFNEDNADVKVWEVDYSTAVLVGK